MSEEIKEAIDEIQGIVDFYELDDENNYDYSDKVLISMRTLLDYITNLQQKVEQLEGQLEEKTYLYNKLQTESKYAILQLENIRKEAVEWVVNHKEELHHSFDEPDWDYLLYGNATDLLNILNKGSE